MLLELNFRDKLLNNVRLNFNSIVHNVTACMCLFCPGALVKTDEKEVINFLLTTEIIPLCLGIMESGSELSQTVLLTNLFFFCLSLNLFYFSVSLCLDELDIHLCCLFFFQVATFILQKILLDDTGLAHICQTYERFSNVAMILVSP